MAGAELKRVTESDAEFMFGTNAVPIRLFLRSVTPVADEVKLKVGKRETGEYGNDDAIDGLHARAVDPANVGMVDVTLPAEGGGFRTWGVKGTDTIHTLGVNVDGFQKNLRYARMAGQGVEDDGDPVEVRYGDEIRRLETSILRPNQKTQRVTTWNLIDPDSVRNVPDIPDLQEQLENRGHVPGTRSFKDAINALGNSGDRTTVTTDDNNEDGFMLITKTGDPGELVDSDFVRYQEGYEGPASGQSSIFSWDFLRDMAVALHRAKMDKVVLQWGDEFPLAIRFFNEDYGIRGTYLLAPRINKDDDG